MRRPPRASDDRTTRPLFPKAVSDRFAGRLVISTGENEFTEPKTVVAPLRQGLTVAVALCGRMSCRINERALIEIDGPNLSMMICRSEHQREQIFAPGVKLRYALVHMAPSLIEEQFGVPFDQVLEAALRRNGGLDPVFLARPADRTIQAVASKIMGCPIRGLGRDLYLIGKALELVALAVEQMLPTGDGDHPHLPLRELERVQAAREILMQRFRDPPALAALAREVGLNVRALNAGFRRAFGMTVHAFLQEHRLHLAYQKIAAADLSVSEIAYEVGYTPAHFATIFRRRFGVAPRELR